MLQNALDILRKEGKEILVCLSGSEEAQKAWLAAGGEAGHMLSARQVESWLMTGGATLPKEIAFSGTLEEFGFPLSQDKRRGQQAESEWLPLRGGCGIQRRKLGMFHL